MNKKCLDFDSGDLVQINKAWSEPHRAWIDVTPRIGIIISAGYGFTSVLVDARKEFLLLDEVSLISKVTARP